MGYSKPVYPVDFTNRVMVTVKAHSYPDKGYNRIIYGEPETLRVNHPVGERLRDNYRFDGVFNPHERHSRVDTNVVCLQGRIL